MTVETDCAEFVCDAIDGALQYDRDDVAEFYAENPPDDPVHLVELVTAFLPDSDHGGPLVWDGDLIADLSSQWITREAAKCAERLADSDRRAGGHALRMPWEMLLELIYASGSVAILENSGGWIWSPAGPPIDTGQADMMAVPAGFDFDDESHLKKLAEQFEKRASEHCYRHAAKLGVALNLEGLEKLLEAHSDSAEARCAELYDTEDRADTKAIEAMSRFRNAQPGTVDRSEAMWAAATGLRDIALTVLHRAEFALAVTAIAEGDTYESVGWDWISGKARLAALSQAWQQEQPRPNQDWWQHLSAHHPIEYWNLRITAASLEEHRAMDGEDGFLSGLGTHPLLRY